MKSYEAIILGGGCSGLSLAMAFAKSTRISGRIAVLEPRARYDDDRTWCFWNVHRHPHEDLISRRWRHWQVAIPNETATITDSAYDYCQIRSEDFYRKAQKTLNNSSRCELRLETAVNSLHCASDAWEVTTNDGVFRAPLIFDSRPLPANEFRQPALWQHFLGWRVEFEEDCLEPTVATLMDFRRTEHGGIHFVYCLPESGKTALYESTFLGTESFKPEVYEGILSGYLKLKFGNIGYRILSREFGCIPMSADTFTSSRPLKGMVQLGTRANCVKPSSGYAFLNIQRHTAKIMQQWEAGEQVTTPSARKPWINWLDKVFLRWLQTHPQKVPQMFFDLFRNVPADNLVRFLSEQPNLQDIVKVVSAMPRYEFLTAAICKHRIRMNQ